MGFEKNLLPQNLHYNTPNSDVPALVDGTLQVIEKNTPWFGRYAAVNSFGFGGSNVHAIVQAEEHTKYVHPADNAVRLFTYSARTEEGLNNMLELIQKNSKNTSLQALAQNAVNEFSPKLPYRGYAVLNTPKKIMGTKQVLILQSL